VNTIGWATFNRLSPHNTSTAQPRISVSRFKRALSVEGARDAEGLFGHALVQAGLAQRWLIFENPLFQNRYF
jgi:hypothetical protein